jgi:type IX secretion system PorP/SprF family membrane protein
MKKKTLLTTVIACTALLQAIGQQRPHYSQYILNNYILNPALSGIENYTDVKLSMRDQWVGLDGAPQTYYLSVHGPIGKNDYRTTSTSYRVPGENPRGKAYWETYTAAEPHHGAGLTIINDKTGLYNRFTANATYAYHLGLSARTNLSAGFAAGISRISYDRSKAKLVDPSDPLVIQNATEINRIRPDLSFGLWLYSADYFIGVSGQQIIPQKVKFSDDANFAGSRLIPHIFATAGYRFLVNDDINAIPSVMVKYVSGTPTTPQFDINIKMQYRDLLWAGASYRLKDGYAAMVGLNVGNTFNVGYSYDFTTTRLNTVSRGTHELIIGFLLGNKYSEACPRCW